MPEPDCFLRYRMRCNAEFYYVGKIPRTSIGRPSLQRRVDLKWFYSLRAVGTTLLEVHALHRVPFQLHFSLEVSLYFHSPGGGSAMKPTIFSALIHICQSVIPSGTQDYRFLNPESRDWEKKSRIGIPGTWTVKVGIKHRSPCTTRRWNRVILWAILSSQIAVF